ncbi:hypothetical protein E9531_14010 [Lampropedia puyangensis]|uniref:Pilus assembly protein PilX n=1 Tax=Lampropedia puyangensis TaxID=1330072 RepID=A0A4S8EXR6_9BURK|nr:hypothetical protein [Lampropedia puyangensis]THT98684.1 hypothetical protein E9531_14010 [Lampropedia puyangensis]
MKQSGVTLIGLLVGMVISLIVVLGMVMLYRTSIAIALDATQSAQRDGQLASGLLAANISAQGAGFELVSPQYGQDLVVLGLPNGTVEWGGDWSQWSLVASDGSTGTVVHGAAVVWRSKDLSGQEICEALVPNPNLNGVRNGGGLAHYRSPADSACASASNWTSISWGEPRLLIDKARIDMQLRFTPCKPFGIEKGDGGAQLTLFALNSNQVAKYYDQRTKEIGPQDTESLSPQAIASTLVNGKAQEVTRSSVCLANYPS